MPQLLTGLRISIAMAWMCIVAAEMISSNSGLGYLIQLHRIDLNYQAVLFDIFLIGLIGYLMNFSLVYFEQKLTPWASQVSQKIYA